MLFPATRQCRRSPAVATASIFVCLSTLPALAAQPDGATVIQRVDAAVKSRLDSIAAYTVNEHYALYRNNDETHSAAEMMVKTTYRRDSGKSYEILSQSGSQVLRSLVLYAILDNEKRINQPGVREGSWITSANYDLKLRPGGPRQIDGRDCLLLDITPRRKQTYLIDGTIWVDAKDGSIVQLQGITSKSPSFVSGPSKVMRQYASIDGFSEAIHVRAESESGFFGKTIVKIDYSEYHIQLSTDQ